MGAEFQEQEVYGKKTAAEAFEEAFSTANYKYGHRGYTGAINTTELTKVIEEKTLSDYNSDAWDAEIAELVNQVPKWETWAVGIPGGWLLLSLCSC